MFDSFLSPITTTWANANKEYNAVFHPKGSNTYSKDPLINIAVGGAIGLGVGVGITALAPAVAVPLGGVGVCLATTAIGAGIGFFPQENGEKVKKNTDRTPPSQKSAQNTQVDAGASREERPTVNAPSQMDTLLHSNSAVGRNSPQVLQQATQSTPTQKRNFAGASNLTTIPEEEAPPILYFGENELMFASRYSNKAEAVSKLIEEGADVDLKNWSGNTALMLATQHGKAEIVDTLIEKGANVDLTNGSGNTALMFAAQNGHAGIVTTLIGKEANVNLTNFKDETALMFAAQNGHAEIVTTLIEKGANVDAVNENGNTALTLATQNGHAGIVINLTPKLGAETYPSATASGALSDVNQVVDAPGPVATGAAPAGGEDNGGLAKTTGGSGGHGPVADGRALEASARAPITNILPSPNPSGSAHTETSNASLLAQGSGQTPNP